VNRLTDQQLLRDYAGCRSDTAFSELVRRHIDFIYSAALRMVCDSHLAEDVTQGVFVALAQTAGQLTDRPVLSGWLHRTTQNLAANTVRSEVRRRAREQEAAAMNQLLATESDATWEIIAPHLDTALGELNEADRDILLLRYFERKSACDMAQILGTSEEAAQKRVSRAVERLREFFSKQKITIGASGLAVLISANAIQAAPVGLAAMISAAAVLVGTAVQTSALIAATKTIAMTTLQKTIICAAFVAAVGTGIFEAHQNSKLQNQIQTLQQQQAPLAEQIRQLQADNESLSHRLAEIGEAKKLSEAQFNELLKLRSQTGQTRTALQELAKMKSNVAQQRSEMPAYFTNAMAQGISMSEKFRKKAALAKLARMKEKLNLTDDQEQAINDLMVKNIENSSQQTLSAILGRPANQAASTTSLNEETAVKALLSPDQLAVYPDFLQGEAITSAKTSAQSDLTIMTGEMDLTQDQQDKAQAALYQVDLNQQTSASQNQEAIAQARASGNLSDAINMQIEAQKQNLEDKLKALNSILTPEQLNTYQQKQLDMIDMQTSAMKMFLPQTNNAVAQ
jgi:RNA polymerase sigma factor (sigma-70 family)